MNKSIQHALIAADRLFEIMDLELESSTNKIALKKEHLGDICFRSISFSYGSRVEIFNDFSVTIKKNEITAITGESGSGKTTLIALLQKLYPLNDGHINIGDLNLEYVDEQSLRKLVGVIPQQLHLFSGSIIDNIALGEDIPDLARVLELSDQLGITSFVELLPQGFETQIGEDGALLSGGQKQRIAIARALYKDPEILLLDEATSALDTQAESIVKKVVRECKEKGKTVIVITHRLSTIMDADTILVLNKGKIVEDGTHCHLIRKKGYYYQLWRKQFPFQKIQSP